MESISLVGQAVKGCPRTSENSIEWRDTRRVIDGARDVDKERNGEKRILREKRAVSLLSLPSN